jgi:hypothetical protein
MPSNGYRIDFAGAIGAQIVARLEAGFGLTGDGQGG